MYHELKQGSGNILGFKIVGGITKKQKKQICRVMEKQISESGKVRLLLVIEPHKTMDSESLLFDLNFTLIYSDKIERMALIGNKVCEKSYHCQPTAGDRNKVTVGPGAQKGWRQRLQAQWLRS